jgi:hypothetical protein
MGEAALVEAYIRSGSSPDGKWWVEFPVGLSIQQESPQSNKPKQVDAVCLTDREQQVPETYPDYDGFAEYTNPNMPESGVTRTELFRRLRDSEDFTEETVSVVEAKTGASSFKAIGQLEAYGRLLKEDFGWTVKEKILLREERDAVVDHAASSLGIRVVNVV